VKFDHIVVGTGSAGSPVIRRLVDAGRRVLVLEAGPADTSPDVTDPAGMLALRAPGAPTAWHFETAPQTWVADRTMEYPRGRVLGGSSAINGMIHVRGARDDFDGWGPSWTWDTLLPYFRRSEDHYLGDVAFHGVGGPLPVGRNDKLSPLTVAQVEGAVESGIRFNPDVNAGVLDGASYIDVNIRGGRRVSAWAGYVAPLLASGVPNLAVVTGVTVTRVLFEGDRAVGVEYVAPSDTADSPTGHYELIEAGQAQCEGDVVLSAGAIGSPQILMLSGIGPAQHLRSLGLEVLADAPDVGENLEDHLITQVVWRSLLPPALPSLNALEAQLFLRSQPELVAPDVQPVTCLFGYPVDGYDIPLEGVFAWMPGLVRPHSKGSVRLASADPLVAPIIDPRYLSDPRDADALLWALELCRELANQPAMKKVAGSELAPGPGVRTRAELRDYLSASLSTYYHPTSTCRLGSVVDASLRVHGVRGLRVADASIMPTITSGNTHAPTVAIGERAADLLLERD
jgi:choline dehydrogenase